MNLTTKDEDCTAACNKLYTDLAEAGVEVLYDDRNVGAGQKFANMDLIGLPWQVALGSRGLKNGVVELKNRATGEREEVAIDDLVAKLS